MALFAGYVGLRPRELFALRPEDIAGELCTIERAVSSRTGEVGPTKAGHSRVVTIPPVAQDALLDVPAHRSGLLFSGPRDRMWKQNAHHYYWARLCKLANREGFDFYELRHSRASSPDDNSIK
jgi:integrase